MSRLRPDTAARPGPDVVLGRVPPSRVAQASSAWLVAAGPARSSARKPATVYECPVCETRLLGTQRCEECGVSMRRLGLGGLSPCCDEPVTFEELLGQ